MRTRQALFGALAALAVLSQALMMTLHRAPDMAAAGQAGARSFGLFPICTSGGLVRPGAPETPDSPAPLADGCWHCTAQCGL
ncbi:MAG: hypothetical protein HXY25_06765, partial [Alphaproteobacteria bacterium]|nr:hypothetical protein [Alphaproteobacteria bacterium]